VLAANGETPANPSTHKTHLDADHPIPLQRVLMALVYVFASSKMEAQPVLALAGKNTPVQPGRPVIVEQGGNRFAVIITGMGTGNARIKADTAVGLAARVADGEAVTAQKPDAIFVIGLSGGLAEPMREERIVAYSECLSADNAPPLRCAPALTDAIIETLQTHRITCDRVIGITSPRIASNKSQKRALARSGASVVDMETYHILSAAAQAAVPAAVLRVVSDSLDADMPDFNSALDANGALIGGKAIRIALGSPLKTFHLLATNKRAMAKLTPAVKLVLQSNCFSNLRSSVSD
jgi:nucleoside phosphorylase